MSSAICQNFVQNAWKKELCSNCFKSKDEHAERPKPKALPQISPKSIESIIKTTKKPPKIKRNVNFTKNLTEIIGHNGGEDWESEESDNESIGEEIDETEENIEEDNELKRITKENTDFNTSNLNKIETKISTTQLLLGQPVVDLNGKKQTLFVSVTPFGEQECKKTNFLPVKSENNKSVSKTNDQVFEKSLLDEITETLENNKNPAIQIISRKKIQKDVVLDVTNTETKNNQTEKTVSLEKKSLARSPAVKRLEQEKPVIYQTSIAKIELLNNKKNSNKKYHVYDDVDTNDSAIEHPKKPDMADNKVLTELPIIAPQNSLKNVLPTQSREQAGEPDGRADPDNVNEPPALPLTPPPTLECQNSFLHNTTNPIYDKPKVPSKPATVLIRKHNNKINNQKNNEPKQMTSFTNLTDQKKLELEKPKLEKQDSIGSDSGSRVLNLNKRRAPKPPEADNNQVYTRFNGNGTNKTDSPVLREKEKRERASSCSPKIRASLPNDVAVPEPAPRKLLSVSTDSLANSCDEKRKKTRFSLKKFLRIGSSKDLIGNKGQIESNEEEGCLIPPLPLPKPRLVIVHPLDLNGSVVEVVPSNRELEYQNVKAQWIKNEQTNECQKAQKPPPPPRQNVTSTNEGEKKPTLPPPPKSVEVLTKQKQLSTLPATKVVLETVYANIGEVRSALVPNKPQRTASMREREAQLHKRKHSSDNNSYEDVDGGENLYDYIQNGRNSPTDTCNSMVGTTVVKTNSPKTTIKLNKRSESSIDISGEYFKYNNIPRSLSLTYCGSETESEIYSPYSFYGSESEVSCYAEIC